MEIGKIVGNVWATRKDEKLNGQKFLVVKLLNAKDTYKEGFLVAADNAGAGNGDLVLITRGSAARTSIERQSVPIDATIVGIVDSLEFADE
ncbi:MULTISPECIES: EutN/CcmL family microcompartment protein [Clostridioides]|uniref:EutN/CcmL family microcompartment protein n=1 Tax=unclassified Clostridioides TaxID=2635829 RepID=UPI001D10A8C8|nr:EutN/CcmL family microcompartment protein [Clostridioides sp. ZZV15-6388]MCC0635863.1 EutN/CcmL family microcompartment protein [Clostridioides sp. ES-S-0001-02]MCC0640874.1 EutN/CcmL family microcompartment protein [Clostridioides sp. ES-S-0049-03]MCC0645178.1 EutN/CcmL family microcompartment protein [Clostridioides sp. ZZV14-6150]MCC0649321.1 EutN/CcmL family microcompartment protein [Clostridioides sp. ZZV15-6598]MCC0656577.1 EutN/CcmL family microcompartment protein [Clostridioides sp.